MQNNNKKRSKNFDPTAFERKVASTIKKYNLFTKKDRIIVACSGGKDSTSILYILKKQGYDVEAVTIDVLIGNYTKKNLENLRKFCNDIGVRLHEFSFRKEFGMSLCFIKSSLKAKGIKLKSCTICGVLRRYILNKNARSLKPSVIVTGHNLDDEAQAIMMNLLRNNLAVGARLGPKTGMASHDKFVPRVKPLYFCSEKDIEAYSRHMKFPVNYEPCPCRADAYRKEAMGMLDSLERKMPSIKPKMAGWFLNELPRIRKRYERENIPSCKECGEPSNKSICQACSIIGLMKPKSCQV